VNGNLLDTNAVIFALTIPDRLSPACRKAILKGPNLLSVVSYWAVVLKCMKGMLDVGDPQVWWRDALDELAAVPLLLRPEHVGAVCALPPHHKDPFDRILIAQATIESLSLVTNDKEISKYAGEDLRIIR
jgi:PIN domain nuclease of toxin-antitoxin system